MEIAGRKVEILMDKKRLRPENSEVNRLVADNRLISQLTDWRSRVSFRDGLKLTYSWIEKNLHHFNF